MIGESPLSRYLIGMLAPFGTDVPTEEDDDSTGEDEGEDFAGTTDIGPPMSQALSPSSIGLSCLVSADLGELQATVEWGEYRARR